MVNSESIVSAIIPLFSDPVTYEECVDNAHSKNITACFIAYGLSVCIAGTYVHIILVLASVHTYKHTWYLHTQISTDNAHSNVLLVLDTLCMHCM